MTWLKIGDWVLNPDDISAAHYTETDGPTIEVYARAGGFSITGEQATGLWAWLTAGFGA
jgi:hypothetical protein